MDISIVAPTSAKARSSTRMRWLGRARRSGARAPSAGAHFGGVIPAVGSLPVIIEDDVLVGGNTGI